MNEIAKKVMHNRYLMRNDNGDVIETPDDLFRRVAKRVASVEYLYGTSDEESANIEEKFYELMRSGTFLPNTPTLVNAGRPLGQLSACFVLPIGDCITNGEDGIYDTLINQAIIHKSGGGTGFDFSAIRPAGARVATTKGVASGPVSFMRLYDASTAVVKQGGVRRGANMAILRVDHPDILDFIRCKGDTGQITNFNISVAVTDAFMNAVENRESYPLIDPDTGDTVRSEYAPDVWGEIVMAAWETGEPGVFFIDEANRGNPVPHLGSYRATNPCVAGDTWVQTDRGPRQVVDLVGVTFNALVDGKAYGTDERGFYPTGYRAIYKLETARGYSARLTDDHPVLTVTEKSRYKIKRDWVKAGDLKKGDMVCLHDHREMAEWEGQFTEGEGYLAGLFVGDGWYDTKGFPILGLWPGKLKEDGTREHPGAMAIFDEVLRIASRMKHRSDWKGWKWVESRGHCRLQQQGVRDLFLELGMSRGNKLITETMEAASSDFCKGFIRGLVDADGTVSRPNTGKGRYLRLTSVETSILESVQRMLARLGIGATILKNRRPAGKTMWPDGRVYWSRARHELHISGANLFRFAELVGFTDTDKNDRLAQHLTSAKKAPDRERFVDKVISVDFEGYEDVYDVTVPGVHAFDGNGFILHNCAEQPLLAYDSCNLGSINLAKFVKTSSGGKPFFDYKAFARAVKLGVRFLDNVIDANSFLLENIEELAKKIRRIGLGVMGLADALIKLGVAYDSHQAVNWSRVISHHFRLVAHAESKRLAGYRGAFPAHKESVKRWKDMRNCNVTTVAPTGSISIIAGCSGGIEPLYAVAFTRKQAGEVMVDVHPEFRRIGEEEEWLTDELIGRVLDAGTTRVKGVPRSARELFVCANEIDSAWHLKHQAAWQGQIDSSISKTINLPSFASPGKVSTANKRAWKMGLKSVTVYRDGSRPEQVLSTGATRKKESQMECQTC